MHFKIFDLGLLDFLQAWDLQKQIFAAVKNNYLPAALLLCRHGPVITIGRSGSRGNILASAEELASRGIFCYEVERGGDVTYHGPGQIMVYPIFNLCLGRKDLHLYLRSLEEVAIRLLFDFDLRVVRRAGLTGVWSGKQKIASVGVGIKNWITLHGMSINVKKNDLDNFSLIRPCGMNIEMTSMETLLNTQIDLDLIKTSLTFQFKKIFGA